jgi:polyphenol oxidase
MAIHPDWIVPNWRAPRHVKALVTTRAGGVSTGLYASLNLGTATGDDADAVRENREILRRALPAEPRWLKQVHGARVIHAGEYCGDRPEADASVAWNASTVCAILVADCLPVLLTDREGHVIAAAHCGWRGLAAGVVDNTVAAMKKAGAGDDLLAYIGPGIGRTAFEVGEDVYRAYTEDDPDAAAAFTPHVTGKWLADLPLLARRALARAGVSEICHSGLCTYSDPSRFYSYRRDKTTGRFAALIWRDKL